MNRLTHPFILIVLGVATCFVSCRNHVADEMGLAESVVYDLPDSALSVLERIKPEQLNSRRNVARYSLLHTMAIIKSGTDTADVSLISPSYDYYSRHGRAIDKAKASFYMGRMKFNAEDYQQAILYFKDARKSAERSEDVYWKAMIISWIGYTYNKNYCSKEELACMTEALPLWEEYGDSVQTRIALTDLGLAYHNDSQPEKADSIYSIVIEKWNPDPEDFLLRASNEAKTSNPDPEKVIELIEHADSLGGPLELEHYYEYAYALTLSGKAQEAQGVLEQLEKYPEDVTSSYWKARIAQAVGDEGTAADMLQKNYDFSISIVHNQLSQSVYKAERDYDHLNAELAQRDKVSAYLIAIIIFLSSAIVAVAIWSSYRRRKKELSLRNERLEALAEEAMNMLNLSRKELEAKERIIQDSTSKLFNIRRQFATYYQSQFEEIAKNFDLNPGSKGARKDNQDAFENRLSQISKEITGNLSGHADFEARLNTDLDDIMVKLRNDFPELKEEDFRHLCYIIVGFDSITRSILLDCSPVNARVRKHRLLRIIYSHKTENSDFYECFIK